MPFNWTDVGKQHWIPSHWQGLSCKRVLPEMADPVSHLIGCICFFCLPCGHPECQREQVLLYLPATGGICSSSSWMAHSTFGAIKQRTAAHEGSRILFRSMEKDLAHRSPHFSTTLAGLSLLGGDKKVTFDRILSWKSWVKKGVLRESSQIWITYKKNKRDERGRFFITVNK